MRHLSTRLWGCIVENIKQKRLDLIMVVAVGISSVFAYGIALLVAIPYLFIERKTRKLSYADIGFKHKNIVDELKKYWCLVLLPILSGILTIIISKFILPEFYLHVLERVKPMLSLDKILLLIVQLLVLALAE